MMKYLNNYLNKIICGDCLEVMKKLPDKCIDLVLTDPPYLVNWQSHRRKERHDLILNDNNSDWIIPVFYELYRILKDNSLMVSFYGWPDAEKFLLAWKGAGFKPKSHLVFVKSNFGLGWFTRGQHENAYLLAKGKPSKPDKAISDVIKWTNTGNKLHPTQKPVDAISTAIKAFSKEDNIILDPFLGSGTTAVACKQLKRNFIGIEISPEYCKIAEERLKNLQPSLL